MRRTFSFNMPTLPLSLVLQILGSLLLWLPYLSTTNQALAAAPITPSGLNTQVSQSVALPSGQTQYNITGGTRPGGGTNLFHSFGDFNVPRNNIANFLNDSGLATSNILARVTGTNGNNPTLSSIYGTIQTTGFGSANLFLMNPAGFLFGPNATINVGGMVAFTTADYLRLADNVRFNAIPNAAADALLSTAPVAAYGFLGSNPGAITVQGSQFSVADGTGISLVGGNITIQSGTPDGGTAQPARLSAPNGKIQLASAASPGEFDATTLQPLPNVDGASFTSFGSVSLSPGSNINVSGANTVAIRGGQFVLSVNDAVLSTAGSTGPPETISLSPSSSIISSNAGPDPGPDIQLIATNFQMDGASIQSMTTGSGRSGAVTIRASDTASLTDGSLIMTSSSAPYGDAGPVSIAASHVILQDSFILTEYAGDGTTAGNGGAVTLTGTNSVSVMRSTISTDTFASNGNGGAVSITAPTVTMDGGTLFTGVTGDGINPATGNGGTVILTASGPMSVTNSSINTSSTSAGSAGAVSLTANDSLTLANSTINTASFVATGSGGSVSLTASDLALQDSSVFTSFFGDGITSKSGSSGAVTLTGSNSVTLLRSAILTDLFSSDGNAGAISITAPTIALQDSTLSAQVIGDFSLPSSIAGNAGAVTLSGTTSVSMTGTLIDTEAFETTGNAGPIMITAPTVMLAGIGPDIPTINASTHNFSGDPNAGHGGDIEITGTNVTVTDFAVLFSLADGGGPLSRGGNIRITGSENVVLNNGTTLTTTSASPAPAGNIELLGQHVTISQSSLGSSAVEGSGGMITITGTEDIAVNSGSVIQSTAVGGSQGSAGPIEFNTPHLTITGGSQVLSETFSSGQGGTVTVQGISGPAQSVLISDLSSGIFTNAHDIGPGGSIVISASSVILRNGGALSAATSGTASSATGGTITVDANQVQLSSGATITANSTGAADAGSINLTATNGLSMQNSSITTQVTPTGTSSAGGNIKITTSPAATVFLQNSQISASVADGPGGGGNISIDPQFVILLNSQILAKAAQGQGGAITINAGLFLPDATSVVNADSGSGQNGTITIQSPLAPASGRILPLPQKPLIATTLLSQRCAALAGGNYSSFTVAGRDSLPAEPSGWLSSPLALVALSADEGDRPVVRGEGRTPSPSPLPHWRPPLAPPYQGGGDGEGETPLLSLRQIAPPGFLTQAFAADWSTGCTS